MARIDRHDTRVERVPAAELRRVLTERARAFVERTTIPSDSDVLGSAVLADTELVQGRVGVLLAGYAGEGGDPDSGAWAAYCSCGWEANNPVPTEEHAQADADAHVAAIYGEAVTVHG